MTSLRGITGENGISPSHPFKLGYGATKSTYDMTKL